MGKSVTFVCGYGRPWAVFCAIAVILGLAGCGGERTTTVGSNVLLIVVDTLRADHVGAYGSKHATPNIDGLAARGVTFERAYSHIPITGPSHSSLFTALLPFEHGVRNNGQILDPQFQTLAEILGDDGRSTAAVVSLGVLKRKFGLGRGFDTYRDDFKLDWMKDAGEVNEEVFEILDGTSGKPYFLWVHYSDPHEPYAPPGLEHPRIRLELNGEPVGELSAGGRSSVFDLDLLSGVNELRFIDTSSTKRRLFRLTNIRIPKGSVEVRLPAEWRTRKKRVGSPSYQGVFPATVELVNPGAKTRSVVLETACKRVLRKDEIRERYALEVEYVDGQIGCLLDRMRERGLLDDTLIVFASDHGEGLGDHKHVGHISQLYDSLLRVPLIMSQPGRLPEGLTVVRPVSLVDVLPTITDLLDLPNPAGVSGVSLLPFIKGAQVDPRPIFGVTSRPEAYSDKTAVIARGHKFIHSLTDDRDWEELYDLEADPDELVDLAPSAPPILDELRSLLRTRLHSSAMAEVNEAKLSEEEIERLRALGYIH
jgi:arylsulfatase A-like enzyme